MTDQVGEQRVDYRISGRVQGVGFRWYTVRLARELGLRGSVRNCADGSVEVRAAGPASALVRLRQGLLEGPPSARVSTVQEIPPVGRLPGEFRVES